MDLVNGLEIHRNKCTHCAMGLVLIGKHAHHKGNVRHVRYWSKVVMVFRNISLRMLTLIPNEGLLNRYHSVGSDDKYLRYYKSDMFENASQNIACDFVASQEVWNVPSWVYSKAACGRAF